MRENKGRAYIKLIGAALCVALICFNSGEQMSYIRNLPNRISPEELGVLENHMGGLLKLNEGDTRQVARDMSQSLNGGNISVSMLGIPIKQTECTFSDDVRLMPGGMPIGVSIYTRGVLVVGLGSIEEGAQVCPAADGGIKAGDVILEVNGHKVTDSLHLGELCREGGSLKLTVRRNGQTSEHVVTPKYDAEKDAYMAGMWVRDSTSGIGTLSYWDMQSGSFGALGHPITDIDTGSIIDVKNGSIIKSEVIGISAGTSGKPGEIIGSFSVYGEKWGTISNNCDYGIYGSGQNLPLNPIYPEGLPVGRWQETHTGPAKILCTVTDEGVKEYDCEIIKLFPVENSGSKGIVIKVISPELISVTGGIVQGMSGSPIIQDGKLVGAVTHVLVNDPTRGYGIFIENMLEAAK